MNIDKIKENNPIYFTIIPSNAGFTDQLYQFSVFYKLGLSLGYSYLHGNYISDREGAENIYDYLGFNRYFHQYLLTDKDKLYRSMGTNNSIRQKPVAGVKRIRRHLKKIKFLMIKKLFFNQFNFIDVGLDDTPLDTGDMDPIEHFQKLVRSIVSGNMKADPLEKNVVRFYLESGRYFFLKLAPAVSQEIPSFQDNLDLYSTYLQSTERQAVRLRFDMNKVKLEMHIRMGDTALIETPWHSFVPLWSGRSIRPLKEYSDRSDKIFDQTMDITDYWRFLQIFVGSLDPDALSIVVFSDGYKRGLKELFRMIEDLELNNDKIEMLRKSAANYDEEKFSIFNKIRHCDSVVGENNEALKELVKSTLVADVLIVGCNQNMISKLLTVYYDAKTEKPAIIIMLYRNKFPDYQIILGDKAVIFPVNVNNLESDEKLVDAVNEIKRRYLR